MSQTEAEQRAHYLATFRIEGAKLANIGPARCAVLRSWGIDTAADVDESQDRRHPRLRQEPDGQARHLARHEGQGVSSTMPAPVIDPLEVQRIDRQLAARRTKLMRELRERIVEVEQRVGRFNADRAALWGQVEAAFNERMLASFGV